MAQKLITKEEAAKLNEAVETLRSFCESRFACKGCPFRKEGTVSYGSPCKFGSNHPILWDHMKIEEV